MGSTKVVYQARDEEEGIDVAWNEVSISASAETVDKFKNEIRVLENLQHSNVIKCSCHFWEGDKLIFISEFMSSNLKDYILKSKNKRLKLKVTQKICRQLLRALHYLHTREPPVIHSDLKCENIFIDAHNCEVKIGDFGLSGLVGHKSRHRLEFMAPEALGDDVDQEHKYTCQGDIYAFGMCVLVMVTGKDPYSECKVEADESLTEHNIHDKVLSGQLPDGLTIIVIEEYSCNHTDVRAFINSCLAPVELRPSVVVLLKDVFLANGSESSTPIPGTAQPTPTTPITSKSLQELQAGLNAPSPEPDVPCSQSDTTSSESVGTTHPPVLQEIPLSETVATTLEPAPMAKSVQVVAGPEIPDIVVPADTLHVGPRVDMRRSSVQSGPMVDSLTLSPTAAMRRASAPANRVNTSPDSLEGHIEGEPAALSFDAARLEEMNGLASPPFPQPVKNRSLTKELLHQHVSAEHGGNGGNRLNSSAHCSETDSFDQYPLVPPQQHVITEMNGIPTNATTPSEGSVTHEHHDGSASPTHSINSQTPHLGPLCCENGNGKEIQRLLDTEQEIKQRILERERDYLRHKDDITRRKAKLEAELRKLGHHLPVSANQKGAPKLGITAHARETVTVSASPGHDPDPKHVGDGRCSPANFAGSPYAPNANSFVKVDAEPRRNVGTTSPVNSHQWSYAEAVDASLRLNRQAAVAHGNQQPHDKGTGVVNAKAPGLPDESHDNHDVPPRTKSPAQTPTAPSPMLRTKSPTAAHPGRVTERHGVPG
jgi:WNK lysine deficient protein kinase